MPPHSSPLLALHTPPGAYECSLVPLRRRGRGKSKNLKARKSKRAFNWLPVAFALLPVTLPLRPLAGGYPGEARSTLLEVSSTRRMGVDVGAGDETMTRYPRERDSLAVRPVAGTRGRFGTFTVPPPAKDSTPPPATPPGEPSPGDFITNVSARRG